MDYYFLIYLINLNTDNGKIHKIEKDFISVDNLYFVSYIKIIIIVTHIIVKIVYFFSHTQNVGKIENVVIIIISSKTYLQKLYFFLS